MGVRRVSTGRDGRGTAAHARICRNLGYELTARLRGGPCEAFMEGLRIEVAGSLRYPDAIVVCGSTDNASMIAENPVVVFEVLSPSAASTDVIVKNVEYRATPSIERYVMLSQDRIAANIYQRQGKDWIGMLVTEIDAVLDMPEIGIRVPLLSLYHGVFG